MQTPPAAASSSSTPADVLDGIGQAFQATVGSAAGVVFGVLALLAGVAVLVVLVRWVRRESQREQHEQEELDARHEEAVARASRNSDRREWVRVPAHRRMVLQRADNRRGRASFVYEECETQNISGGSIEFLSFSPPAEGVPLQFTLDLGEKRALPLRGAVVRIEPANKPGAPSLVAVKLGPVTAAERERVVRWVRKEELRDLAQARRGRLCTCCLRPLAEDAGEMHTTCASGKEKGPALRAAG